MKVKLTDDEVATVMALAVNASIPVGYGWYDATNRLFKPGDFLPLVFDNRNQDLITLDYVEGRIVKMTLRRCPDGEWEIGDPDQPAQLPYQSWCRLYPTYEDLVLAATGSYSLEGLHRRDAVPAGYERIPHNSGGYTMVRKKAEHSA